jgi:hypothetical protein
VVKPTGNPAPKTPAPAPKAPVPAPKKPAPAPKAPVPGPKAPAPKAPAPKAPAPKAPAPKVPAPKAPAPKAPAPKAPAPKAPAPKVPAPAAKPSTPSQGGPLFDVSQVREARWQLGRGTTASQHDATPHACQAQLASLRGGDGCGCRIPVPLRVAGC